MGVPLRRGHKGHKSVLLEFSCSNQFSQDQREKIRGVPFGWGQSGHKLILQYFLVKAKKKFAGVPYSTGHKGHRFDHIVHQLPQLSKS